VNVGSLFSGIGNALVPQIAEWIGRRIMTFEQAQSRQSAFSAPSNNLDRVSDTGGKEQ